MRLFNVVVAYVAYIKVDGVVGNDAVQALDRAEALIEAGPNLVKQIETIYRLKDFDACEEVQEAPNANL